MRRAHVHRLPALRPKPPAVAAPSSRIGSATGLRSFARLASRRKRMRPSTRTSRRMKDPVWAWEIVRRGTALLGSSATVPGGIACRAPRRARRSYRDTGSRIDKRLLCRFDRHADLGHRQNPRSDFTGRGRRDCGRDGNARSRDQIVRLREGQVRSRCASRHQRYAVPRHEGSGRSTDRLTRRIEDRAVRTTHQLAGRCIVRGGEQATAAPATASHACGE